MVCHVRFGGGEAPLLSVAAMGVGGRLSFDRIAVVSFLGGARQPSDH